MDKELSFGIKIKDGIRDGSFKNVGHCILSKVLLMGYILILLEKVDKMERRLFNGLKLEELISYGMLNKQET